MTPGIGTDRFQLRYLLLNPKLQNNGRQTKFLFVLTTYSHTTIQ